MPFLEIARRVVGGSLKCVKRVSPDRIQVGADRSDTLWIHLVHHARPRGTGGNETRVAQHPQMLGNCRPAHRQVLGELTDCGWLPGQELEDTTPSGISKISKSNVAVS